MTHRKQVINIFSTTFKYKNKSYQISVAEKYILVLSFMTFYHNINTIVHKVIVWVIYSSVDNFICLHYLGILHQRLSAYDSKFEKKVQ